MAVGGRLEWDDVTFDALLSSEDGPVGQMLARVGEVVAQGAKRRCPVSPAGSHGRPSGYTRSQIGWQVGTDESGMFVDVSSPALSLTGYPIGLGLEVGTAAHVIRSHGPYPLRNRRTGQVFGHEVHHPGTAPQPHLRPAIDDARGLF